MRQPGTKMNTHYSVRSRFYKECLLAILIIGSCVALRAQSSYAANFFHGTGDRHPASQQKDGKQQKISLKVKNEKLSAVLDKIEKQTEYVFVYSNDDINASQKVSIEIRDSDIKEVLDILMKQIDGKYDILKDKIILRNKLNANGTMSLVTGDGEAVTGPTTATLVSAADVIVTGQVLDEKGQPLEGVSVTLKGLNTGTKTDRDGRYTIALPPGLTDGTLVFSFVGYAIKEERIGDRKNVNIALTLLDKTLEDVVVVAYGTQKRISVTGAVDGISKKAIEGRPVTNLSAALQGVSPNLIIQQRNFEPGQGVNINIRGLGTLGDNTPLVVIDGIAGGDINLINPADIESISILKDAGTAAIYGSRSANGVILITTKKGRKNSPMKVAYNGIFGIQSPRVTYEPVHAWENAYYKNESLANSGLAPAFTPQQIQAFKDAGDGDWRVDNLFHDATQQSHNLTVSGGGENTTTLLSLGYFNQRNNFIGPDYGYKRYNIRLNQTNEYGRLKLNTILSYVKVQGKDHSYFASTLIVDASRVPLYYSFQDSAGNYLTNPVSAQFNPKAVLENGGFRRSNDDEIFGNLNAELAVTKDLKVRGVFGGTVRSNTSFGRRLQLNFIPGGAYGNDREVFDYNSKSLFTNLQLIAEYTKKIKSHDIKVLVGGANESFKSEASQVLKTLTDPNLGVPTTSTIVSPTDSYNSLQGTVETSINSLFGRLGYAYNNRYFVEFNFRYDGSSKFAEDNRWGLFPSGSFAWRLTEETFMQYIKQHIGDVKVRTSYGILGNQNVNAYQYQTSFFNYANAYAFNNTVVGGAGYTLGNPSLTWEKAATFNIGADGSFLRNRLEVSFDYFDKTTSDILYKRRDVPQFFGAGFPDYNVAKVKNRGWEIKAAYNLAGRHFRHTIAANIADNLNELIALTSGATEQVERKEEFELLRRIGQPITVYYGYKTDGFYQTLDDINKAPRFAGATVTAGDLKFVDRNKDGVIDDRDKFILGNPFPRYTFGFSYAVSYKGFDFSTFVQGVGKREAMIRGEQVEPFHFGYGGTMYRHQTDYWTPTNPDAKYPRLAEAGSPSNTNNYRTGSDLYLFDAAYLRVKNVQLGYTLPAAVTRKAGMQHVRVYFTAQNVLTLTKLNFLDPEITEFNNNSSFDTGANSARAYFLPVFFGGGIDITF